MGKLEFSAWLVPDRKESVQSFETNTSSLARVYPVWSFVDKQGMPLVNKDASKSGRENLIKRAHDAGTQVHALVSNYTEEAQGFDKDRARIFLADDKIREAHASRLVEFVKEEGIDGINLDYESLYAEDMDLFTAFVKSLSEKLHAQGKELSAAVHAKRSDGGIGPEDWNGPKSQDWKALCPWIDYFQPMCYDFHSAESEAGPVAPPQWDGEVLDYCLKFTKPENIEMGIPSYGLDWLGKKADPVNWEKWLELEKAHGPARRDETQELTLGYADRKVFYNDSIAWLPKLKQAVDRNVRGISMWVLGSEDPRVWNLIDSMNKELG